MYAYYMEQDGFEFLVDLNDLWRPSQLVVRCGRRMARVRLDDEDVGFINCADLLPEERQLVLATVHEHLDELLTFWHSLRNDVRRGRVERNTLVD